MLEKDKTNYKMALWGYHGLLLQDITDMAAFIGLVEALAALGSILENSDGTNEAEAMYERVGHQLAANSLQLMSLEVAYLLANFCRHQCEHGQDQKEDAEKCHTSTIETLDHLIVIHVKKCRERIFGPERIPPSSLTASAEQEIYKTTHERINLSKTWWPLRIHLLALLGNILLRLQDENIAITAFSHLFKFAKGRCEGCGSLFGVGDEQFVCRVCPLSVICGECWEKCEEGYKREHPHLGIRTPMPNADVGIDVGEDRNLQGSVRETGAYV
ncbi:hypothetical protein B0J14DRAFT_684954 [Halenospora varia]|nr:hypothetical protein B0J14DRAFT_684954 [Halenospora varia]